MKLHKRRGDLASTPNLAGAFVACSLLYLNAPGFDIPEDNRTAFQGKQALDCEVALYFTHDDGILARLITHHGTLFAQDKLFVAGKIALYSTVETNIFFRMKITLYLCAPGNNTTFSVAGRVYS